MVDPSIDSMTIDPHLICFAKNDFVSLASSRNRSGKNV